MYLHYASRRNPLNLYRQAATAPRPATIVKLVVFLVGTACYTAFLYFNGGAAQIADPEGGFMNRIVSSSLSKGGRRVLSVTTWNIAAINNNPFEYWITYDQNKEYQKIMERVEEFIEYPGNSDFPVSAVFTEKMFTELETEMNRVGWDNVRSYWESDYKNRKIISGFMKDSSLGKKRLASMPDRFTNTINVVGSDQPVCRPTVINMYDGDLGTLDKWWNVWKSFMFEKALTIKTKDGVSKKIPYQMLKRISRTKYPAITQAEEKVSLPLQTMCGAIFDAILVHMMNTIIDPFVWQSLKKEMVEALNKKKVPNTLDLLNKSYGTSDIITLQEVSSSFVDKAKAGSLGKKFWIYTPFDMDEIRDQNSVILLNRRTFPKGRTDEITKSVHASFPRNTQIPVASGDINVITATDRQGIKYVVGSFHGDTDGLATIPVSDALSQTLKTSPDLSRHKLVFGLDANTYENATPKKQQGVLEWGESYLKNGWSSCWGDVPQKGNYTTFNARTYLQTQLNKACKSSEKRAKGDVNPKDFIIFKQGDFTVEKTIKDNTGKQEYVEGMAFPTLTFPSDHGILSTRLVFK